MTTPVRPLWYSPACNQTHNTAPRKEAPWIPCGSTVYSEMYRLLFREAGGLSATVFQPAGMPLCVAVPYTLPAIIVLMVVGCGVHLHPDEAAALCAWVTELMLMQEAKSMKSPS
uniref:Uncharacterized protein n=1 Tax=Eutreptiella gymnastica TaxID=73025 RepID=A0A7S1HXG4_9EUGL|mmetsp:Transcript_112718/g.195721  ORF Transcript_112718/g.195721 Transcript_112718/m.195721 type:complete len:114 (+) Transcript_112718:350-691(+)